MALGHLAGTKLSSLLVDEISMWEWGQFQDCYVYMEIKALLDGYNHQPVRDILHSCNTDIDTLRT